MIRVSEPIVTAEDAMAVFNIVDNGYLSGRSPIVQEFEEEFAKKMIDGDKECFPMKNSPLSSRPSYLLDSGYNL